MTRIALPLSLVSIDELVKMSVCPGGLYLELFLLPRLLFASDVWSSTEKCSYWTPFLDDWYETGKLKLLTSQSYCGIDRLFYCSIYMASC